MCDNKIVFRILIYAVTERKKIEPQLQRQDNLIYKFNILSFSILGKVNKVSDHQLFCEIENMWPRIPEWNVAIPLHPSCKIKKAIMKQKTLCLLRCILVDTVLHVPH